MIKDYEGGTLMECIINQKIDYLSVRDIARQQREVRERENILMWERTDANISL